MLSFPGNYYESMEEIIDSFCSKPSKPVYIFLDGTSQLG